MTYSWLSATGLSNPNISNPTATPNQTTTYCVFVADANNCTDSVCVTIYVEAPCGNTYYLPNAFSPNGDTENDVLKILPDDIIKCITEFKLAIYDRWGEEVFESINPAETLDGSYKGKIMNSQVLAYYLHIVFTDGTLVDKPGNVSLVR